MPTFVAADLDGHTIDSNSFSGRKTALLFVSTKCISCRLTLQDLDAVRSKGQGNVVVICHAPQDDCRRMAEEHDLRAQVIADEGNRLGELFGITAVPTAVLVDEDLRLASYGHPMSADEVDELLTTESTDREAAAVSVPTPAADSNSR
ncbi:MAG: peroxiredoxin family protein [Gaiellaceae bacterium]